MERPRGGKAPEFEIEEEYSHRGSPGWGEKGGGEREVCPRRPGEPPQGTEILSKEYYSRLSVLSRKYNKHFRVMTKPDHGGIKSPKSRFQGEAGDAGKRKQSSRHPDNTPRYCWGHTGGGGCGVKVPLSSGVFPAQMEKSREGHSLWALVLLSSGHHRSFQWLWPSRGTLCHGWGQWRSRLWARWASRVQFGLSQFPVTWSHSCNWRPD